MNETIRTKAVAERRVTPIAGSIPNRASAAGKPVAFGDCYGAFHASAEQGEVGVVLCAGLSNDACTAYRSLRLTAAALASAGYPALRYDYPDTGNAPDTDGQEHVSAWLRSVGDAIDWLRGHAGVGRVVLVGFRLGALLAATVARERDEVCGLVLLAPYLRGRAFVRQVSIEASMNAGGWRQGADLSLHDLTLGHDAVEKISAMELRRLVPPARCAAAIFAETESSRLSEVLAAWRAGGVRVEYGGFDGCEALMRPTFMCHEPPVDALRIVRCVTGLAPQQRTGTNASVQPALPVLRLAGCAETPLRFGPQGRLFGILCRPDRPAAADKPVVILVNSSGNPSQGFARLPVRLARRLAANGLASFRIDFAGLGDSLAEGDAETHCFATDRTGDIRSAIDFLRERGFERFAVLGLCSGAYHAFHAALADDRIADLFLLNMPLFQWREGDPVEFLDHAIQSPTQFLPKLFSGGVWKRLVSGELGMRARIGMQLIWCCGWAKAAMRRAGSHIGLDPAPGFPLRSMRTLSARARTAFFLSPGDESVAILRQTFGDPPQAPGAVFEVIPGADHSFTSPAMHHEVADRILGALGSDASSAPREAAKANARGAPAQG